MLHLAVRTATMWPFTHSWDPNKLILSPSLCSPYKAAGSQRSLGYSICESHNCGYEPPSPYMSFALHSKDTTTVVFIHDKCSVDNAQLTTPYNSTQLSLVFSL